MHSSSIHGDAKDEQEQEQGQLVDTTTPTRIWSTIRIPGYDEEEQEQSELVHYSSVADWDSAFSMKQIRKATDNLSNVFARGMFSTVYYGTLEDGNRVAIKSDQKVLQNPLPYFLFSFVPIFCALAKPEARPTNTMLFLYCFSM